jgi:hypothetical protein
LYCTEIGIAHKGPQAMLRQPTRLYTLFIGVVLTLQGISTLLFRLYPPLDQAFPLLLELTRMIPPHSVLHMATGFLGLWAYFWGGPRAPYWFALGFGLFYVGLAAVGQVTGHALGLGLYPFDHPFHLLIGGLGLIAVAIEVVTGRRPRVG